MRRTLAGWLTTLCLWLSGAAVAQASPAAPELHFKEAEFVVSDAPQPPRDGWASQALPDSWLHNHPGLRGIAWYRMRFTVEELPPHGMALYVSRVAATGQFWLNGSILNPEVRFTQDNGRVGTDTRYIPFLIPLPREAFRVGDNAVYIRVEGFAWGGDGLWDVRLGPIERLHPSWQVLDIGQRLLPLALFVLLATGTVFGALVWWFERRLRDGPFMLVMVLWTIIVGLRIPDPLPLTRDALTILISTLLTLFYWSLLIVLYRYARSDWRWYPRVVHIVCAVVLLAALALTAVDSRSPQFSERMGMLLLPTLLLRVLATAMLLRSAWKQRSLSAYALAASEMIWFSGQLQLMAVLVGWLPPEPFRLDPACALPLVAVLLFIFAERLVREREQAVRDQQSAISSERARILQDVHDGIGSQLVTALRLARKPDADRTVLSQSIEGALQDLRLIIDSLDAPEQGLLPKLADFRHRMEPSLAQTGVRLEWKVQQLPELAAMAPHSVLSVLRFVQEAMNNALRHAQPTVIGVSVANQGDEAVVSVADNGIGFLPDAARERGHGLSGMRQRAQKLGATMQITPREGGGTTVSLHLPLGKSASVLATA